MIININSFIRHIVFIGLFAKAKIKKFKDDEVGHKNSAYQAGATNKGIYSIMDKVIRTGSRIAITISEKI